MKRVLLLMILSVVAMSAYSQSMKMVVDTKGQVVGRYVRTNATTYTVGIQDYEEVPKTGNHVVTFKAEDGQGVIWIKASGNVNVRSIPSTQGKIVGKICNEEGLVPETFPCLGKVNGWYKLRINGKVGFVRGDLCEWDGMDTL